MKIAVGFLIVFIAFTGIASAQPCDPYLPCGPLPWSLPSLPDLQSPTPIPTMIFTAVPPTPTPGGTPVPTSTPFVIPTYTPFVDTGTLNSSLGTLQAMVNATAIPVYNLTGTPVSMSNINSLTSNIGTAFNYARGLAGVNFGALTPLVLFIFTGISIFLLVRILLILLPIFAAIWGVFRKIIDFILGFIPL